MVMAAAVAAATATTARWSWWGWVVTFCVFVQHFLFSTVLFNYSILFVCFREEFDSGAVLTGWVGCLSNGLMFILSPLGGFLMVRMGYRSAVLLGVMMLNLGLFATSYVPNIYWALASFGILAGTGAAVMVLPACCLVFVWFPNKNSSMASGLAVLGSSVGFTAMAPVMTSLIQAYGWRIALRILSGGLMSIGLLSGLFLLPPSEELLQESKEQQSAKKEDCEGQTCYSHRSDIHKHGHMNNSISQVPQNEVDKATDAICEDNFQNTKEPEHASTWLPEWQDPSGFLAATEEESKKHIGPGVKGYRELVTDLDAWLLFAFGVIYIIGWTFFSVNFASYVKTLGFTHTQAAWAIFTGGMAEILGKVFTACLGDHLPCMKINVMAVSAVLMAVNVGFLAIAKNWADVLILSFACGLFRGAINSIGMSASYQLLREYGRENSLSVLSVGWGTGIVLAPPITGGLFEASGDYNLCLLVLVGLLVVCASCILAITVRRKLGCLTKTKGNLKKGEQHSDKCAAPEEEPPPPRKVGIENEAYDYCEASDVA